MDWTRRSVLQLVSSGVGISIAGCSTRSSTNSPTSTSTATLTSTTTTSSMEPVPVTFTAEVLRQASAENPAEIRARLESQSSDTVRIGFGPTLLYTDNTAADDLKWANQLVLEPETSIGPWDDPIQDSDGCWRFPEDGMTPVQSSFTWRDLSPSESLTETYAVYTSGDSGPCLPEGSYRFQDQGNLENDDQEVIFTLSLQIDSNQQLQVNTEDTGVSTNG